MVFTHSSASGGIVQSGLYLQISFSSSALGVISAFPMFVEEGDAMNLVNGLPLSAHANHRRAIVRLRSVGEFEPSVKDHDFRFQKQFPCMAVQEALRQVLEERWLRIRLLQLHCIGTKRLGNRSEAQVVMRSC